MQLPLYAWPDVALVYALCALPLGVLLGGVIRRRTRPLGCMVLAALLVAAIAGSLLNPIAGSLLRPVLALLLAISGVLMIAALVPIRPKARQGELAIAAVAALVLIVAPASYVNGRCRHDLGRLSEYVQQSRVGDAGALIRRLLVLDPTQQFNGHPLPGVAADIEKAVAQLNRTVASPLTATATLDQRLERAQALAMLGRSHEALELLSGVHEPAVTAEVQTLCGTIYEHRGAWQAALDAYQRARVAWEARPASAERAAGLLQAVTGMAYAQRKSGDYSAAAKTYEQVLALAPTADSHFLLAQFYEDAQQAGPARHHARVAMTMAPQQYQQQGSRLINKLAVYHFGCLGVFSAEKVGPD